mmetsp:Transcript_49237/g.92322  ORF Transcript_49237/g.92322 Transcript_49237/m.92322 type:complete len:202 (+) Transcript_49237:61-666(+)
MSHGAAHGGRARTVWKNPSKTKDQPYVPLAKLNSGPLWAHPKAPVQLQTEFRTHYGHFRDGAKRPILSFAESRWLSTGDLSRPVTADATGFEARSGSAVAAALGREVVSRGSFRPTILSSSASVCSSARRSEVDEDDLLDPAALFATTSGRYGQGTLPAWVNDKKSSKPMSPEVSFASNMIQCGIPFDASIRFSKAGDLGR